MAFRIQTASRVVIRRSSSIDSAFAFRQCSYRHVSRSRAFFGRRRVDTLSTLRCSRRFVLSFLRWFNDRWQNARFLISFDFVWFDLLFRNLFIRLGRLISQMFSIKKYFLFYFILFLNAIVICCLCSLVEETVQHRFKRMPMIKNLSNQYSPMMDRSMQWFNKNNKYV